MKYQRKFIIEISINGNPPIRYIQKIYKNKLGYNFISTSHKEKAIMWKSEKTCKNTIELILKKYDSTRQLIQNVALKAIEITDNQTLRKIKLDKLNKKLKNISEE